MKNPGALISWTRSTAEAGSAPEPFVLVLDLADPALLPLTRLSPSEADRARAVAYGDVARAAFFARRGVLRHILARRLGCAAEAVVIEHDASGAPRLAAPRQGAATFLSLSGRGSFAALALASRPIGVDLEILAGAEDVPMAMLHPNEAARLAGMDAVARHRAFLEIWTVKEAYLKALRTGLSREPAAIEVSFEEDGGIRLVDCGEPVKAVACMSRSERFAGATVIVACAVL